MGILKEETNSANHTPRDTNVSEQMKNDLVVTAVKGLGEVEEKEVIVFFAVAGAKESFIEEKDVVIHPAPREKTFLVNRDNAGKGAGNQRTDDGGNQPIDCQRWTPQWDECPL